VHGAGDGAGGAEEMNVHRCRAYETTDAHGCTQIKPAREEAVLTWRRAETRMAARVAVEGFLSKFIRAAVKDDSED
jgi:hypothetical protein